MIDGTDGPQRPVRARTRRGSGAETRAQLLDAALEEFARRGYDGATILDITRAVGVRPSAFYVYFASKKEAYDELFAEAGPAVVVRALLSAGAEEANDPAGTIRKTVFGAMDAWTTPRARAFASLFLRDAFIGEAQSGRTLLAAIDRSIAVLAERFEPWIQAGRIRQGVTPEHLAWELFAPLNIVRFLHFNTTSTEEERQRGEKLIEDHVAYFLMRNLS